MVTEYSVDNDERAGRDYQSLTCPDCGVVYLIGPEESEHEW